MSFEVAEAVVQKAIAGLGKQRPGLDPQMGEKIFGDIMYESLRICFPQHALDRVGILEISYEKSVDERTAKGRITLDRLYRTLRGSTPEAVWERLVGILLEVRSMVPMFEDDSLLKPFSRDQIVPLLKLRSQVAHWNSEQQKLPGMPSGKQFRFPQWPVAGEVVMTVAADMEKGYAFLTHDHLTALDLGPDAAKALALDNLRKLLAADPPKTNYRRDVVEIRGIGGLASSLLLLDDFWQEQCLKAKDALVVFAQNWDNLLVARKSDRGTLSILAMAYATRQMNTIFSGAAFVYDAQGLRQASLADLMT